MCALPFLSPNRPPYRPRTPAMDAFAALANRLWQRHEQENPILPLRASRSQRRPATGETLSEAARFQSPAGKRNRGRAALCGGRPHCQSALARRCGLAP